MSQPDLLDVVRFPVMRYVWWHVTSGVPITRAQGQKQIRALPEYPESIPWALAIAHLEQMNRNHSQTASQLARRGGLSPEELVAVLEDRPWRSMSMADACRRLAELVKQHEEDGA